MTFLKYIILFFALSLSIFSQGNSNSDSLNSSKFKKFEMQKSPTTAIMYSLILPGLGQVYTENYWKAPLFLGGSALLVYLIVDNNSSYNEYETLYQTAKAVNPLSMESIKYKSYKEYYRDIRDQSAFYLVGVYLISAIDAYVGAHLFDFNVTDEVKLNISPQFSPCASLVSFQFKF